MRKILVVLILIASQSFAYADWNSSTDMQGLTVSAAVTQVQDCLKAIDGTTGTVPTNLNSKNVQLDGATSGTVTLTPAAVAGTNTYTLPAMTGAPIVSTLTTNAADAANSVWGTSNDLTFEGATADDYETAITVIDPTGADKTFTLPNYSGTAMISDLSTNAPDAANSVWSTTNKLAFEGATANDYETWITPTDPTADRTITLPNSSGTVAFIIENYAKAYRDAVQSIGNASATKVQLNAEEYDGNSEFDSSSNYRYLPTTAGYYLVIGQIEYGGGADATLQQCLIYKNGAAIAKSVDSTGGAVGGTQNAVVVIYMNGSTDYLELYAYHTSGGAQNAAAGAANTFLICHRLSAD